MPQKQNPDVLELVRAKSATVMSAAFTVSETLRGLPGGYNRDLQETKVPFIEGIAATRASVQVTALLMKRIKVNKQALFDGFSADVFAADKALELTVKGMSFRDAYNEVKKNLAKLERVDPVKALAAKKYVGAPAGLDFGMLANRMKAATAFAAQERNDYSKAISKLLGIQYSEPRQ